MPPQLKRILILTVVIVTAFMVVRTVLVPKSFGVMGHYRANSLAENENHVPKYIGVKSCANCHDSIVNTKAEGSHKALKCEACHGPAYLHVVSPKQYKLDKPQTRQSCAVCHALNKARANRNIVLLDVKSHNIESEKCIECHNPHAP